MQVRYQLRHSPKPLFPPADRLKQLVQFSKFLLSCKIGPRAGVSALDRLRRKGPEAHVVLPELP